MGQIVNNPPAPGTDEWRRMITASKVADMLRDGETGEFLGIGYFSAFERYMQMTGEWEPEISDETMAMFNDAHDAEDYAVNVWLRANEGWQANAGEVAYTDETLAFPNMVTLDRRARRGRARKIIEVKRPRIARGVRDGWRAQVIFQMGVSGIHNADLVEVPVYGTPVIHHIEWDADLYAAICADAAAFFELVRHEFPPAAGDSEHAKEIFGRITPDDDKQLDWDDEQLADEIETVWAQLAEAERAARTMENKVMEMMGDAKKATLNGRKLVSRTTGRFSQARVEDKEKLKDPDVLEQKVSSAKFKKKYPDEYAAATGTPSFKFERKEWTID